MKHICGSCGFIYDSITGFSRKNIGPGTSFSEMPSDWTCPACGAHKSLFEIYSKEF